MPKKSKYNLHIWYNLKVPKKIGKRIIELYGKEDWTEAARDILNEATEEKKNE